MLSSNQLFLNFDFQIEGRFHSLTDLVEKAKFTGNSTFKTAGFRNSGINIQRTVDVIIKRERCGRRQKKLFALSLFGRGIIYSAAGRYDLNMNVIEKPK
jgi:hypothetical protein